jgi:pimeloyl-ACP methyl ester carboxylesterase
MVASIVTACGAAEEPASRASATEGPAPSLAVSADASLAPSVSGSGAAGGLVSIGDRSLWLECSGEGDATVIFESGMGGDHRTWEQVTPPLEGAARLCTYERAGIGQSESAPAGRTAAAAVADLHALLAAAGEDPPYVMAGFSFGGAISQLYAATYPDDIAGLVLVESNHPREWDEFEPHLSDAQIAEDREFSLDNPEGMDPYASFEEMQAAGPLPDVPLVVVTAGESEGWPPGWDPAIFDALRAAQQEDLTTFTSKGRQVIAEGSTHHVPSQRPDIVVEAVHSVLAEIETE